jgi:hypothetical protein
MDAVEFPSILEKYPIEFVELPKSELSRNFFDINPLKFMQTQPRLPL